MCGLAACYPRTVRRQILLLVLCSLPASCGDAADPGSEMVYGRLQRDLLVGAPSWEVVQSVPEHPPRVQVVTPSRDQVSDSGDQLALVLPAPAEVRFHVSEEDGAVQLRASAGVHLSLARALAPGAPPVVVDFEIEVNGEIVARRRVETSHSTANDEVLNRVRHNSWTPFDPEDVPLAAGDEVHLRTILVAAPPGIQEVPAAFGSLRLERVTHQPRTTAGPDRPNLVLFVMDTERFDRTSAYGYSRPTTPNLEQLANRGLLFEQAYATSSWTWPSMASMLTGRAPAAHGVRVHQSGFLAHELQTLAEVLQEQGFTTGAFVANPLLSSTHNYDQGFERFEGNAKLVNGGQIVPQALEWLEANREHRFFLYLHLVDPHTPHTPRRAELEAFTGRTQRLAAPDAMVARTFALRQRLGPDGFPLVEEVLQAGEGQWYSDVYDACVHQGDHWLGVVLERLQELGLTENTVVAYTSDHGEELLDHRNLGHGHELWQELVRVPLVLAGPGIPAGERVTTPVSNRHLGPSLARFGGARLGVASEVLFLGDAARIDERPIFFETHEGWWKGRTASIYGVRRGDWVLHWCLDGGQQGAPTGPAGGEVRLYHLGHDAEEREDLAPRNPDLVAELKTLISSALALQSPRAPGAKDRSGWGTRALLQAIGYASGGEDD